MISAVLIPLCFGIIEGGLLLWTRGALQSTAALVARCAAIRRRVYQSADLCGQHCQLMDPLELIAAADVTVTNAANCPTGSGSAGSFKKVTITSSYWSSGLLPAPFGGTSLSVTACYPRRLVRSRDGRHCAGHPSLRSPIKIVTSS